MNIRQDVTLELNSCIKGEVLEMHEGDTARAISITLTKDNQVVDLSSITVKFDATINNIVIAENVQALVSEDNKTVILNLPELSSSGFLKIDVKFYNEYETFITAETLTVHIQKAVINKDSKYVPAGNTIGNTLKELKIAVENKADKSEVDTEIAKKADKSDTYTKSEIDAELAKKINEEDVYTAEEVDERFQRILTAGDNIKIDDNKQGKITISADLSKKYDAANVESGNGELSLYSEDTPVTSAKFNYQKIGDFVMLTLNIVFSASAMGATKAFMLLGLPYKNETIFRKSIITTSKTRMTIAVGNNSSALTIITQGEALTISDGESIQETFIYKIKK